MAADTVQGSSKLETTGEPVDSPGDAGHDDLPEIKIPVGISRLHLVELPLLKVRLSHWLALKPIAELTRAPDETDLLESST
jgi:hypothetical protein